jgi:hypothetical protein
VIGMLSGGAEAERNGEHFELKRNVASGLRDKLYIVSGTNYSRYKSCIAHTSTVVSTRASIHI